MKNLLAGVCLLFSFNVAAQDAPGDANAWVHSVQDIVKTERVTLKKSPMSDQTNIGLMIPVKEMLVEPGKLTDGGKQVLEMADAYVKQFGRKLSVLLPDEKHAEKADDCNGPGTVKKGLTGAYVYIFIKD
ncbi:MAG: hypothetical protein KGZ83_11560 [Sulfuricella sp.]|nr:hypothetical protein [Sulfuricella sp.]